MPWTSQKIKRIFGNLLDYLNNLHFFFCIESHKINFFSLIKIYVLFIFYIKIHLMIILTKYIF